MFYYPKSQIKTNLQANEGEYIIEQTKESYVGPYYKVSNGDTFIGANPNSKTEQIKIIKNTIVFSTPDNKVFIETNNKVVLASTPKGRFASSTYPKKGNFKPRSLPLPYKTFPTPNEKQQGEYMKYFVKKNNDFIYFEISKEDYNNLTSNSPSMASDIYEAIAIIWYINNFSNNLSSATLIEKKYKWYGFSIYLQNKFG